MRNLFEHTSASWVHYSDYKWKEKDGNFYLLPTKDAVPKPYDPMKDAESIVLTALTHGNMGKSVCRAVLWPCMDRKTKRGFYHQNGRLDNRRRMWYSTNVLSEATTDKLTYEVYPLRRDTSQLVCLFFCPRT